MRGQGARMGLEIPQGPNSPDNRVGASGVFTFNPKYRRTPPWQGA